MTCLNQGILDDVWKYKLIFVETPDANETSIALENYRRVGHSQVLISNLLISTLRDRHVTMVAGQFCSPSLGAKSRKESISTTITDVLSSCLGWFYFILFFHCRLLTNGLGSEFHINTRKAGSFV